MWKTCPPTDRPGRETRLRAPTLHPYPTSLPLSPFTPSLSPTEEMKATRTAKAWGGAWGGPQPHCQPSEKGRGPTDFTNHFSLLSKVPLIIFSSVYPLFFAPHNHPV